MNMRRKILIGSFLAAALLLSAPFIAPLQARSMPSMNSSIDQSSPTIDSSVFSAAEAYKIQRIVDILLKQYGNDPKIRDICQQLNAIINGDLGDDSQVIICFIVVGIIFKIYEIMDGTDDP
jgi:hypothetical protein